MIERCAGLDIGDKTVTVCARTPLPDQAMQRASDIRTFRTSPMGLERLRAWLASEDVTDVALESAGRYWRTVYIVLKDDFRLVLVDARHGWRASGRWTGVKDCEWLARLLEGGLLEGRSAPPPVSRDLES